jgi:hypothetical protein
VVTTQRNMLGGITLTVVKAVRHDMNVERS